jgi:uncharacterized protein (DUF983 family)
MASSPAHHVSRAALPAFVAAAALLITVGLYKWLSASLADSTLPVVLIMVPLVTLASLLAPASRHDRWS